MTTEGCIVALTRVRSWLSQSTSLVELQASYKDLLQLWLLDLYTCKGPRSSRDFTQAFIP